MNYLTEYQTFKNKQQLNDAIHEHLTRHKYDLNETDRKALKMIARYAVKFAGAAHLKAATIAELIDKSEKTARRVINKLESLGIVRKVPTIRKINGGKGANILQILPVEDGNDQSTLSSREDARTRDIKRTETQKSAAEPLNSIKQLKNNTYKETAFVPATALQNSLPSAIYDAMSPYFNAADIYKYYGILLRAKRSVSDNVLIEDNPQPFVTAFQNAILKLKQGKIRNLSNYLYRAWQSAAATIVRHRVFDKSDLFYDWLADA
jgi:predicted transcriptional regulator